MPLQLAGVARPTRCKLSAPRRPGAHLAKASAGCRSPRWRPLADTPSAAAEGRLWEREDISRIATCASSSLSLPVRRTIDVELPVRSCSFLVSSSLPVDAPSISASRHFLFFSHFSFPSFHYSSSLPQLFFLLLPLVPNPKFSSYPGLPPPSPNWPPRPPPLGPASRLAPRPLDPVVGSEGGPASPANLALIGGRRGGQLFL